MAEETTKKNNIDVNDPFSNKGMFAIDKSLGGIMGANQPKTVDNTNINKAIAGIEKPASGSVYDKLAARYRSQGEGAVLRTQKNLANLFLPTVNLIQEREAQALARYTLLKQGLEDFDDSTIFGQADGSEMPIVDEIKNLANMTKEDMRELSRLNPADERYDVLAKKIQKNNEAIAKFDDINKKLLEIRNSQDGSADASQWSKGMTQTERDMWMDIYTGKGNNIKIQDGKLVWTDTRAERKYDKFEDLDFLGDKFKALGGNDTDLGWLYDEVLSLEGEGGSTFSNAEEYLRDGTRSDSEANKRSTKKMQKIFNNLNITDDDGNKLDEDGVFGEKTKQAFNKYLAKKDELEKAYLDENLSKEDKQKYGSIVEGSVGRTKVIDLNNISSGPTMIENAATITERKIQGGVQDLINSGVDINDPNYQRTVKSMIYQLNQTGPAGIKSLIFDGLNTDDDDIFTSENTNSFIEGVIANNAKEFGIKDPENMTEQELESAIEKLKEGDVTIQYYNDKGQKESLQRQYLHWYKSQIDAKVEAGVKSKFSTITGKPIDGGGGNKGGGDDDDDDDDIQTPDNEIDTTVADNFTERFGTDIDQMFSELTTEDSTYVGGGGNDGTTSGLLFNYGDNEFVENTLNRTYGVSAEEFGDVTSSGQDAEGARMSFHFEALDYLSGGFGDRLDVYYRDFNGTVHKKRFEFDNTGDTDLEQSQALQQWMRGKIRDDQRFIKGITSSNAKKYVPKDTSGEGSYDPNENTTQTSSTTSSTTNTSTTGTPDSTGTFRDTMSSSDQSRVNKFKIVGTSGAGKANIFKNNKPIRAKVKGPGGFMTVNITGVRAEGDNLVVGTSVGDQDLGRFEKRGDKYVFVPGNAYKYLEGEDKKDFDAFKTAIETDTAFAEEVRGSVTGTSIFNTSNY